MGVGTFGSHISNAEQEFKEMWDEIERHRGVAAVETVTRSGLLNVLLWSRTLLILSLRRIWAIRSYAAQRI